MIEILIWLGCAALVLFGLAVHIVVSSREYSSDDAKNAATGFTPFLIIACVVVAGGVAFLAHQQSAALSKAVGSNFGLSSSALSSPDVMPLSADPGTDADRLESMADNMTALDEK